MGPAAPPRTTKALAYLLSQARDNERQQFSAQMIEQLEQLDTMQKELTKMDKELKTSQARVVDSTEQKKQATAPVAALHAQTADEQRRENDLLKMTIAQNYARLEELHGALLATQGLLGTEKGNASTERAQLQQTTMRLNTSKAALHAIADKTNTIIKQLHNKLNGPGDIHKKIQMREVHILQKELAAQVEDSQRVTAELAANETKHITR